MKLSAFTCPHQVVRPRFDTRHFLNGPLQPRPESHGLQRVITPASGDTEVDLVGGHVVYAVMFPWEDNVAVLQPDHQTRESRVRVRPFVDLVGEGDKEAEHKEEGEDGIPGSNLLLALAMDEGGHRGEKT